MKKMYVTLDGRHKGHPTWKYCVPRPTRNHGQYPTRFESMQHFFDWRNWCWATWRPSKELDEWLDGTIQRSGITPVSQNPNWCWTCDTHSQRIYLRGDAELTLFLLKWA